METVTILIIRVSSNQFMADLDNKFSDSDGLSNKWIGFKADWAI